MSLNIAHVKKLLHAGQAKQAECLLNAQLQQGDNSPQVHSLYAHSLLNQGKRQEAITYLQDQINANRQSSAQLTADLAGIYLQVQEFEQAEHYFTLALKQSPTSDQLWHLLGIAQFRSGNTSQAYHSFSKAEYYDAYKPELDQAERAIENNDVESCQAIVQGILSKFPVHPQASFLLASILLQKGQIEQAAEQVKRALGYSPYHQNLINMLAQIQVQLCDFHAALDSANNLVSLAPDSDKYMLMLADIQQNAGKMNEAIKSYQKAMALGADEAQCRLQIAHLLQSLGAHDQAINHYRFCLQSPEHAGSAFWGLINISQYQPTGQDIQQLERLQFDPDISAEQACQASFSLARVKEKDAKYEQAFAQYENANALKTGLNYVPQKAQQKFTSIKNIFSSDLFDNQTRTGDAENESTPVFIVGLPRTGSTLLEQILSSHSQVEVTMELKALPAVARQAYLLSCRKLGNNRGDIHCLTDAELTSLGRYYLKLTEVFRNGGRYFIDKLPPNFQHIGLINKILPKAIIIETRRQPMAWGMAVFRQYFAQGHDFSYDLEHIAHAYHNYLDLMEHWKGCLGDSIITIEYEKLVVDPDSHIRALLVHCGLEFEPDCLMPHLQQRYVRTASSDQVRKPIYQSAIDSWKHYEEQLAPLRQAFDRYQQKPSQ